MSQGALLNRRGTDMARQQMQKCTECGEYCLSTKCPKCGGVAKAAAPIKWSPDDKRAHLRRKLDGVEEPGWAESLPTLPSKNSE